MSHHSGRLAAGVTALLMAVTVLAGSWSAPASATATFTTRGSIRQVETWGHPAGSTVELRNASNQIVATGTADAQGAFLFRNLSAGPGYTVSEGGATSAPVAVTALGDDPAQTFYQGITLQEGYGYLPTRDGTLLSVNITFPKDGSTGPWPVVVDYSGYDPSQPGAAPQEAQIYPWFGYVVVAVNMRGSGCSGGAFWFFEDAQRTDGYDAIEAVANQSWSNGNVGMVGISYSGYSQLYVAATRPPHLRAITPLSPFSDTYRGILYPGGILNNGFARTWALERQAASQPAARQWVKDRIAGGDTTCAANQVLRLQSEDLASEITPGRFNDPAYAYLDPSSFAPLINVPTYVSTQWQDEQTGGYGAELATVIARNTRVRAELTNGTHVDPLGPEDFLRVTEFVDFYVGRRVPRQQGNAFYRSAIASALQGIFGTPITLPPSRFGGYTDYAAALAKYESEPPVRIRFENGGVAGKEGAPYANQAVSYASWPLPGTQAERWYLQPDGGLARTAPAVADDQPRGTSSYTYDPTVKRPTSYDGSTESMWLSHPDVRWLPEAEGRSLSFVTPPAATKLAYAGTGSVDLWLRSSAADTDLEVTLTEVRPDGKEVYIQSGWLRASRRKLDAAASTPLRPRQTFLAADAAPLPAGQFVPVRIELFPFAQIVRPGSRLRLNIEAPGGNQPFWAFDTLPGTATNEIGHSVGRPSSVVLPLLTDNRAAFYAPAAAPSCSVSGVTTQAQSLRNQPCRNYLPARVPAAVTATPRNGQVDVAWQAPPTWPGGVALTGYRVTASPTGGVYDVPPGTTTLSFTDVSGGGPFSFRVSARYGTDVGPQSDASPAVTVAPPTGVAGRPANASAVVSWKAPAATGGRTVTGYVVTPYVGSTAQAPRTFASSALTQTVTGLANATSYRFTVAATYGGGNGPPSAASDPVLVGAPSTPGFASAVAGNASARVSWWPPSGNASPVTGYVVTPYAGGAAQAPRTFTTPANAVTVTGLTNGTPYTFSVAAVNAVGTGPASAPTAPVTPMVTRPAAPAPPVASPRDGAVALTWAAPADGGSPITGYVVTPYVGGTAQPARTFASANTAQVVTGLANGTTYAFTVAAVNAVGTGPASAPSVPVTVGAPTRPAFPRAVAGSGSARVSWWPPADNGSPITSAVVTPFVGDVAQTPQTFTGSANAATVTGLAAGTSYTFTVAVRNARGSSPVSARTSPVTPT
ncbi:MAG: CocE/NonD family hydrolase [Actinobacteria bacterium]|nr:CocE/NonD family hydrolase [Actinomycetota bacterium]